MNEKDKFDEEQYRALAAPAEQWPPATDGKNARPVTAQEAAARQHAGEIERAILGGPKEIFREHVVTLPPPESPPGHDPSKGLIQRAGPRYRDANEFDREVVSGDRLYGGDRRPIDDSVIISEEDSDRKYKLTMSQAVDRGLKQGFQVFQRKGNKLPILVDPALPETKVHIMAQGSPLCGFTNLRPVDWPQGHERISLDDYRQGVRCTCSKCAKVAGAQV